MANPTKFFNVSYNFDLGEDANGDNPYRNLRINDCFFIKRNGTFITTPEELNNYNGDLLIVRRSQQGEYDTPNVDNFDNYPELFDPANPDADRNGEVGGDGTDIGANKPYKITDVTKGTIEHFSAKPTVFRVRGGQTKKADKTKKTN